MGKGPCRALEGAAHRHRHAQLAHGVFNGRFGFGQGHIGGQVEADGRGRGAALVVDGQRCVGEFQPRKTGQRNALPQAVDEKQVAQRLRALQVFGGQLHHHTVLVERVIDNTHLALAERIVQRVVDVAHGQAHAGRRLAVYHQRGLQAAVLLVGVHVHQFRQGHHGAADARVPGAQVFQVVALQGVLVGCVGLAPANADVLHRHHEQIGPGFFRQGRAQARDDLFGGGVAFLAGFERHEHLRRIALRTAGKAGHVFHRRVGPHNRQKTVQPLLHGLERGGLVGLDKADDTPGVLLREKAFGNAAIQVEVEGHHSSQQGQREPGVPQSPTQGFAVGPHEPAAGALHPTALCSAGLGWQRLHQVGTHHGRGGERHHHRHQDGGRQHHPELPEVAPHNAAHQQHRNEHRNQREADRHHGETNLAGPGQGRLQRRFATFHVAADVLQHHNGIVHHKTGGHGQRHQAQVVQAVTAQVHHHKGAAQRHRHGHSRNQRHREGAQKQDHHQNHQTHRNGQGTFHLNQAGTDGGCAVHHHLHMDGTWDGSLQVRQQRMHLVDGFDDVGTWGLVQNQQHRRFAIGNAVIADVLDAVHHLAHILQAHRAAAAVTQNQRRIVGGGTGLVVGTNLPAAVAQFDKTLWAVGVVGGYGHTHVFQRQAVGGQPVGVQFHAHGGQGTAANRHLANAVHLRQTLRQHGGGGVVHLPARERVGRHGQDHDGGIGRVHLAVSRVAGHAAGQQRPCCVDGGLHVTRSTVDVAVQVELQDHPGIAQRRR